MDESRDHVVIVVEDDGPGLPAEAMDVVFRIGERLDEQVPGSGLGLPIVRDLAQLYGGEIRLENSLKGGLRAILKLPRARTEPGPARRDRYFTAGLRTADRSTVIPLSDLARLQAGRLDAEHFAAGGRQRKHQPEAEHLPRRRDA